MADTKKIIAILLFAVFLKGIIFSIIVPIWHTPDEQAHFAQVAYNSEFGKMPTAGNDLNAEIYESEVILGTLRDERGNNKFTYHPEYRIEYSNNIYGVHEQKISSLDQKLRKTLVKQEASNYPPLYYQLGSLSYNLFYGADLFDRIYAVRFISILLSLGTIYIAFLIGKKVFPKDKLKQLLLPVLVSFQPMFSFVGSGVNSDNLFNFLFSIFLLTCLMILEKGIILRNVLLLAGIILLMYSTKPQVVFAAPIFLALLILLVIKDFKNISRNLISRGNIILASLLGGVLVLSGFFWYISTISHFPLESLLGYLYSFAPGGREIVQINFFQFLKDSLKHTYAETIPWYWGVFDWLGVVMPRLANRILNYIAVFAVVGIGIKLFKDFRKKQIDYPVIFLLLVTVIYYLGVTYYNYIFTLAHGYSFGIQGRYFFPTIVAHMALVIVGLTSLIPLKGEKWESSLLKFLGLGMILLNFVALWVLTTTYYDISNINILITQMSQYKIGIFKGWGILIWVLLYFISLSLLIKYLIIYNEKK